jgi:hypothetical protein
MFVAFTVRFKSEYDANVFRTHFVNHSHNVDMKKCKRGNYDITIEWQ